MIETKQQVYDDAVKHWIIPFMLWGFVSIPIMFLSVFIHPMLPLLWAGILLTCFAIGGIKKKYFKRMNEAI